MTTRRLTSKLVALFAALAACGGGPAATTTIASTTTTAASTTTTTEAGFEVTSEDGRLTITVPGAAAAADPGITITRLEVADFPSGLGAVAADPTLLVYDLGPDGTEFATPVTVALTIDLADLSDLAPNEIPAYLLFTTSDDGFEMYGDLSITRRGSLAIVSGTVSHFSPVIAVREATTPVVTIDRTELESVGSLRSVDQILELMTEVPGAIPVTAGFRDQAGTSMAGQVTFATLDGIPATAQGSRIDIRCDEISEIEVAPSFSAVYGSDAIGGVVNFIITRDLFPESQQADLAFALESRVRCLDPNSSMFGFPLSGFEVATDHPGDKEWIVGGDFLGGLSGSLVTTGLHDRLAAAYFGLICDNDGDGVVDPTDTMFPAFRLTEVGNQLQAVAPLFAQADYFIYLYDGAFFSGTPVGSGWVASDGLSQLESMYTGPGRFESALGVVSVGVDPFVYTVGPDEPSHQVDGATLRMIEFLRLQDRF